MALLDQLLAGAFSAQPSFEQATMAQPDQSIDEAENARAVAARRLAGATKRKAREFGADAEPVQFGDLGMLGQRGSPLGGMASTAPTATEGDPNQSPSTNDPLSSEPVIFENGVPLPKPRPVVPSTAGPDEMSSAGRAGVPLSLAPPSTIQTPGQTQPAAPGGLGSVIGNILKPENAPLLLSLAGGLSGAPSFGTGMRRAFSGAAPAAMQMAQLQQLNQSRTATFQALRARGVPQDEAMAAVLNPDVLKAVVAKHFETKPRVPHKIGVDMMGNDIMGSFDPNSGKFYNANNQEIGGGASGGSGVDVGAGMLAKDVKELNQELPAEEYKAQFSPQVQAQIDNYIAGDTMPTGNPRLKGSATKVKEWAQLYGQKAGLPVSDAIFMERRKMRTDIASSGPNSMGGILANGKSAFGHLANLSDKFVDLGNISGPSVPGGGHIGTAGNVIANSILPSPQTKGKIQSVEDNALKYGQEATKFYAGTGGGVAERMHALATMNPRNTTAEEQAAFLQTEKELMLERVRQKEAQIRNTLGDDYLTKKPVMTKDVEEHISKIDANIARLRGTAAAKPPAPPAAGKASTGVQWSIVQ